jgi:predicted Ser/Thr protein kinase
VVYNEESQCSVTSEYFLKENEEYVDFVQLANEAFANNIDNKTIYKLAKKHGLSNKIYKKYIKEKQEIQKVFGILDKDFVNNMGFVISTETGKITNIISRI